MNVVNVMSSFADSSFLFLTTLNYIVSIYSINLNE